MVRAEAEATNPVYRNKRAKFSSRHIYFYYLEHRGRAGGGYVEAYHFIMPFRLPPAVMEAFVPTLLAMRDAGILEIRGNKLSSIEWRNKSYLVVVLRDPKERLIKEDAIVVTMPDDGNIDPELNKTFRGGTDVRIMPPRASGFFCRNIMKNKRGCKLGRPGKKESEYLTIAVQHNKTGRLDHARRASHTDTGTNTGPPLEE
jgi:hypothetical protein